MFVQRSYFLTSARLNRDLLTIFQLAVEPWEFSRASPSAAPATTMTVRTMGCVSGRTGSAPPERSLTIAAMAENQIFYWWRFKTLLLILYFIVNCDR